MAGARNMFAQNQAVQNAQGNSLYVIGWAMQLLGILGGAYAKNAWPGETIRWIFELVPWDGFISLVLILWFAGWAIDIIWDLTPNQAAVTFGFMGPILSVGQSGTLATHIDQWTTALQGKIGGQIESFTGNLGTGTLAIACMGVAVIVGKRVLAKRGTGAGGGGGR